MNYLKLINEYYLSDYKFVVSNNGCDALEITPLKSV
jgi:hypothetical protein